MSYADETYVIWSFKSHWFWSTQLVCAVLAIHYLCASLEVDVSLDCQIIVCESVVRLNILQYEVLWNKFARPPYQNAINAEFILRAWLSNPVHIYHLPFW